METVKTAEEAYRKARYTKMRQEYGETMERLHALPFNHSVSTEIALVTHQYAKRVADLLTI